MTEYFVHLQTAYHPEYIRENGGFESMTNCLVLIRMHLRKKYGIDVRSASIRHIEHEDTESVNPDHRAGTRHISAAFGVTPHA